MAHGVTNRGTKRNKRRAVPQYVFGTPSKSEIGTATRYESETG